MLIPKLHLGLPVIHRHDMMAIHAVQGHETAPLTGGHSIVMGDRGVPQPNLGQTIRQRFSLTEMGFATYPVTYLETLLEGQRPCLTPLTDLVVVIRMNSVAGGVGGAGAGEMIAGIAEEIGTWTLGIGEIRHIEMNAVGNVTVEIGETEIEIASEAAARLPAVDRPLDEISETREIRETPR